MAVHALSISIADFCHKRLSAISAAAYSPSEAFPTGLKSMLMESRIVRILSSVGTPRSGERIIEGKVRPPTRTSSMMLRYWSHPMDSCVASGVGTGSCEVPSQPPVRMTRIATDAVARSGLRKTTPMSRSTNAPGPHDPLPVVPPQGNPETELSTHWPMVSHSNQYANAGGPTSESHSLPRLFPHFGPFSQTLGAGWLSRRRCLGVAVL